MADPNSIALAAAAESEGLQSVLVGGNAVVFTHIDAPRLMSIFWCVRGIHNDG